MSHGDFLRWALRRLPFTLAMALAIAAVGVATGAPTRPVNEAVLDRWGYGLHDFWQGQAYSLLTGVFFTRGPLMFWGILVFVFGSIGLYEWLGGTRWALRMYWLCELGGACLWTLLVVLPLWVGGTAAGRTLVFSDDVGMSGGGFGCLGARVRGAKPAHRRWLFGGVMAYLLVRLVFFTELSADTLHLVTFSLGYGLEGYRPSDPSPAVRP